MDSKLLLLCGLAIVLLVIYFGLSGDSVSVPGLSKGSLPTLLESSMQDSGAIKTSFMNLAAGDTVSRQSAVAGTGIVAENVNFYCQDVTLCSFPNSPLEVLKEKITARQAASIVMVACGVGGDYRVVIGSEAQPAQALAEVLCP
ncbi:MAG: hypothetical protein V1834_02480 [Candidatus Micrarchaeota archaeon]